MVDHHNDRYYPLPSIHDVIAGYQRLAMSPTFNRYHDNDRKCCILFALHASHAGAAAPSFHNPHVTLGWSYDHYGHMVTDGLRDGWDSCIPACDSSDYLVAYHHSTQLKRQLLSHYRGPLA